MPRDDPNTPLERLLDEAGRHLPTTDTGWNRLTDRLRKTPQAPPPRSAWPWLGPVLVVAAAACVLAAWLGLFPDQTAVAGEIEVKRLDVELTVLSVAETEDETLYMPLVEQLGRYLTADPAELAARVVDDARSMPGKRIGGFRPPPPMKLTGQGLVKDHRMILNLRKGDNVVRFTDVAASIDPTSVVLISNTDPTGTVVVEQNFEYDLATADALLKRYLDRKIQCIGIVGKPIEGYLVSYDPQTLVLAEEPPAPGSNRKRQTQSLQRDGLQAIRLNEMPRDLLVKPTLVWKLRAEKEGQHDTTLSYLCGFVKWQADYVVEVRPADGLGPDLLDVTGWVTLENSSGAAYPDAKLKLIAGDVNRMRDPWAPVRPQPLQEMEMLAKDGEKRFGGPADARKELVEKSFFEYHLYTLTAPTTVKHRQIKQLQLLGRSGVKATRRYVFDPGMDGERVAIELTARNEKDNALGLPLPKGRVMLQQRDTDGTIGLLGRTQIDHTAVKEELALKYGHAFDVTGQFRQVRFERLSQRKYRVTQEMRVRNHKTSEIHVRAVARLGNNWTLTQFSLPFEKHDYQTVHFDFTLRPNAEQVITYVVEYEN